MLMPMEMSCLIQTTKDVDILWSGIHITVIRSTSLAPTQPTYPEASPSTVRRLTPTLRSKGGHQHRPCT